MNLKDLTHRAIKGIKHPSIYFGHPVSTYDTHLEEFLVSKIEEDFQHLSLYNPNNIQDKENYKIWREVTGKGMNYYFDVILPNMKCGVFLPFEDGMWGAGVWNEAKFLDTNNKPILMINSKGLIQQIFKMHPERRLSIQETRNRVYGGEK